MSRIENVICTFPAERLLCFLRFWCWSVPAQTAVNVWFCKLPDKKRKYKSRNIIYSVLGITEIYKVGGAQFIAALAFEPKAIAKVTKIFGSETNL
jgi:histidinol dehydrogenase